VRARPAPGPAGEHGIETRAGLAVVRRRSRGLIQRRTPRRVAPVAIGVAIFVATVVFGVVLEQIVLAQSAFKMARLTEELARAEATQQELLLHATRLESPTRIQRFARRRLGMVQAQEVDYLVADVAPRRPAVFLAERRSPGGRRPPNFYAAPSR
jgi:cell division protein FtsB